MTRAQGTISQNTTDPLLEVQLMSAVLVLARQMDMNPSSDIKLALFTVNDDFVKGSGIIKEEAIVEPDRNCFVTEQYFSSCVSGRGTTTSSCTRDERRSSRGDPC